LDFLFRVSILVAGGGFAVGLLLLCGGSANFVLGWPSYLLETPPPLASSCRWPMDVQCLQSIQTDALRWWFLRLYHDLEYLEGFSSDSCGSEFLGIAGVSLALQVGAVAMGKKNPTPRNLSVISIFFGVLFVKKGCTVYQFNISSIRKKKKDDASLITPNSGFRKRRGFSYSKKHFSFEIKTSQNKPK